MSEMGDVNEQVNIGKPLSIRSRAIMEAGKGLVINSFDSGKEYCKHMMTISASSIPVYVGLIGYFMKDSEMGFQIVIPAILLLLSLLLFGLGLLPLTAEVNIENITEMEKFRNRVIRRRFIISLIGYCIYSTAILFTVVFIFFKL